MRLWVTGASGFVAGHLVPALRQDGHVVTGLGLLPGGPEWLPAGDYRALDVSLPAGVAQAAAADRPEGVIHLAGQASAAQSFTRVEETFAQNLGSALGLLEGLRRAGLSPRVLLVSTSEVYGPQASAEAVDEEAPLRVVSPYGSSKLAAEMVGEMYARVFSMPVVRVRPFSHTGPGQDERFALSSFALQIAEAESRGEPGTLKVGNLEVVRDYLHVGDVADAYRVLLAKGEPGGLYNIASGHGYRMRDLLDHMVSRARVALAVETDASRLRAQDLNFMVGGAARLTALGWAPRRTVTQALDELLDWRRAGLR